MTNQDRPLEEVRNTLGEYARIIRRRWRLALMGAGLVGSLALWCGQYMPRRYGVSTLFERRDDVVLRNLVHKNSPYSFDNLKSTIVMDMTGSRAMAEAAMSIGLLAPNAVSEAGPMSDTELRALDAALRKHDLTASVRMLHTSPSLDTIRLECEANDPETAREFVVALRDRYIAQTRDRITEILRSTKQFFETEVERIQREVTVANQALAEQFKDFPGVDPTDLTSVGNRLETLQQEHQRLTYRKAELEAQISAREEFLLSAVAAQSEQNEAAADDGHASPPPTLSESEQVVARAITQVEQQIVDALSLKRMTMEHPAVKALCRQAEALSARRADIRQQRLANAPASMSPLRSAARDAQAPKSPERLRVELELDALHRQMAIVQASYEEAEQRMQRFTALHEQLVQRGDELREISNQVGQDMLTIATWRQHLGLLNRILTAENEERGTLFVLIEEPKSSGKATSPQFASVFAVCSGSGLAAAALLVALAELLDRSFRSTGQVARVLGIPVLECVGVIPTPRVRRRRIASRLIWVPTLTLLMGLLVAAGGLTYASLERPRLHQRAITKLEGVLPDIILPRAALEQHGGQ